MEQYEGLVEGLKRTVGRIRDQVHLCEISEWLSYVMAGISITQLTGAVSHYLDGEPTGERFLMGIGTAAISVASHVFSTSRRKRIDDLGSTLNDVALRNPRHERGYLDAKLLSEATMKLDNYVGGALFGSAMFADTLARNGVEKPLFLIGYGTVAVVFSVGAHVAYRRLQDISYSICDPYRGMFNTGDDHPKPF